MSGISVEDLESVNLPQRYWSSQADLPPEIDEELPPAADVADEIAADA